MLTLPWKTSYSKDRWCHLVFIPAKDVMLTEHSHEYHEVFVTLCPGMIHYINGKREVLTANTLTFIRPNDKHRHEIPRHIPANDIVMINLGIPLKVIEELHEKLFDLCNSQPSTNKQIPFFD